MTDPAEPTGHTIDGTPWEEPRPPHLPDPVANTAGRIPLTSWVFVGLAFLLAAWDLSPLIAGIDLSISSFSGLVQHVIPTVAPALFGAALFARHPDARVTDPRLVFGIVLLIVVMVLELSSGYLGGLFSGAGDDLGSGPTAAGVGLRAIRGMLTAFALVYLARGLLDARAYEDDAGARRRTRLIAAVAIAGVALQVLLILDWIRRAESFLPGTLFLAYNVVATVGAVLVLGAQAYLGATAWTGARSGERPAVAWRWAAIGWAAMFAAELLFVAVSVVATLLPPADQVGSMPYTWAIDVGGWVWTLGWLAAIASFVFGLPRGTVGTDDDSTDDDATDDNETEVDAAEGRDDPAPDAGLRPATD